MATHVRVIVGNPPYSVGQKSANDNAKNLSYPDLEKRISETYAEATTDKGKPYKLFMTVILKLFVGHQTAYHKMMVVSLLL